MPESYIGKTVALTLCPGHDWKGNKVKLSGLYDIEDGDINNWGSAYFLLVPHGIGEAKDSDWYDVDDDALIEQIDPKSYGRMLAYEREAEFEPYDPHCVNVMHNDLDCRTAGLNHTQWCNNCRTSLPRTGNYREKTCPCGLLWRQCAGMACLDG